MNWTMLQNPHWDSMTDEADMFLVVAMSWSRVFACNAHDGVHVSTGYNLDMKYSKPRVCNVTSSSVVAMSTC
jgi:hypothetical protein